MYWLSIFLETSSILFWECIISFLTNSYIYEGFYQCKENVVPTAYVHSSY